MTGQIISEYSTYNELRRDGIAFVFLAGLGDVPPLRHVLCVLLVRLPHLWCAGHLKKRHAL